MAERRSAGPVAISKVDEDEQSDNVPTFSEYSDPRLVKTYDTVNPIAEYETFYLDLAAKLSASSIIDIACGTGLLTCELAKRGHRLMAWTRRTRC
jgi:predicted RNA methylase